MTILYTKLMALIENNDIPTVITDSEYSFYLLKYPFLSHEDAKHFMTFNGFWLDQYTRDSDPSIRDVASESLRKFKSLEERLSHA